ncbi:MAG: IS110 family transposase [Gemmatimonadetes bacterium]|nr:IS110 family transposase [Gemmatimonadota bacterium]
MEVLFPRCAGIDIHKRTVVACRIVLTDDGEWLRETRTYGTTTEDLLRLSDWLAEGDCTHVGLESTGEFWKPVFNLAAQRPAGPRGPRAQDGRALATRGRVRSCCACVSTTQPGVLPPVPYRGVRPEQFGGAKPTGQRSLALAATVSPAKGGGNCQHHGGREPGLDGTGEQT